MLWSVVLGRRLKIALVGASVRREEELPGFAELHDFASESANLAIASLKASALADPILAQAVSIDLLDLSITWDHKGLTERALEGVLASSPDLVGLSCYCWSVDSLLELARRLKVARPEVMVLLGGPSAGPVAEEILGEHPSVDAIARGEGEGSFVALLEAVLHDQPLSSVPGLIWRDVTGQVVSSSASAPTVDLAKLPSPYLTGVLEPEGRSLLLETSRGCRYRCRFCSWAGGLGRLRYRPIQSVAADLAWAAERGISSVKLADTAINFHDDRLALLAETLTDAAAKGPQLGFTYFLKQELLTPHQAELLAKVPTDEIIIGVESLNDEARRAVGKPPFDACDFSEKMAMLSAVGPVTLSLILGLPGDSPEGLARTLDWMLDFEARHPATIHMICLFWLAVLPGSRLHRDRAIHRFRLVAGETPFVLESRDHSPDELLVMARAAAERHYRSPVLRLEYFHKEYLLQDAPRTLRHTEIPRRARDDRKVAALVGWREPDPLPGSGAAGDLELAGLKAYAETFSEVRAGWRLELVRPSGRAEALDQVEVLGPSLVVLWGRSSLLQALRQRLGQVKLVLMTSEPADRLDGLADGIIWGSSERAFVDMLIGPVERVEPVSHPSPYQWGLIQERGETVRMQLRDDIERVYGDLRWALEERFRHVCWLDESLPASLEELGSFVAAVRRADPDGVLRHSYALNETAANPEALELLSALPTELIRLPRGWPESAVEAFRVKTGAQVVSVPPVRLTVALVESLLAPWRRRGELDGWRMLRVFDAAEREDGSVRVVFGSLSSGSVDLLLSRRARDEGFTVEVAGDSSRLILATARLVKLVEGMLARGAQVLERRDRDVTR